MTVASLSPSGEAAWQSLRQHVEWTPGFWLGWIFTDHSPSGRELFDRVADQLHGLGRSSVIRQPSSPEELVEQLAWVLGGADGVDGCVAIEIRSQSIEWIESWGQLLLRLNERRELLRRVLRGGLLLIGPTAVKARTRVAAPDLWSIRSLALDVEPPGRLSVSGVAEIRARAETSVVDRDDVTGDTTELVLAQQAVAAAQRAGQPVALTEARIRLAAALMAAERGLEARGAATLAVAEAPSDELAAHALVTLGSIEMDLDDLVASERHYREALSRSPSTLSVHVLHEFTRILLRRHALDDALSIAYMNLDKVRSEREQVGEDTYTLRYESLILDEIGYIAHKRGDLAQALDWYRQSLDVVRRVLRISGETPESLRDESIAIDRIGDILNEQGSLASALDLFRQGLDIDRRIRGIVGETTEALRDESISLERIGGILLAQGDMEVALANFRQSLELRRMIRGMTGDTPDVLRGECASLSSVGDTLSAQGELSAALENYRQCLELARQIRGLTGDTAEALRGEFLSLGRMSRTLLLQGELAEARVLSMQILHLARLVRAIVGDLPWALRDETVAMTLYADVLHAHGDSVAVLDSARQVLALARRIYAIVGDTPEALRDMSIALWKVGLALSAQGDDNMALELFQESLAIIRKYREIIGETPAAISMEKHAQERIDDIIERQAAGAVGTAKGGGVPGT